MLPERLLHDDLHLVHRAVLSALTRRVVAQSEYNVAFVGNFPEQKIDGALETNRHFAADGATSPWYIITGPNGVYVPSRNETYVAWEAWNTGTSDREHKIARYDHVAKTWSSPTVFLSGADTIADDDHGVPAICIDHQGYVHTFSGPHVGLMKHLRSVAPYDISSFTGRQTIGASLTYPHPIMVGSTMYVFYRDYDSVNSVFSMDAVVYKTTSLNNGLAAWSSEVKWFDVGADARWYGGPHILRGTDIHIVGSCSNFNQTTKFHVFYFIWDTTTDTVRNWTGDFSVPAANFPVSRADADAHFTILLTPPGREERFGTFALAPDGTPHILNCEEPSNGNVGANGHYRMDHLTWNGSSWVTTNLRTSAVFASATANCMNVGGLYVFPDGRVRAYWTEDPDAEWTAGNTPGHIVYAERSAAGVWGPTIRALNGVGSFGLAQAAPVLNGLPEAHVLFAETSAPANEQQLKCYLFGDKGFVGT